MVSKIMIEFIGDIIYRTFIEYDRWRLWLNGARATFSIAFFALLIGIAIGFIVALVRVTHSLSGKPNMLIRIANRILRTYVTIIRGVPVVVQVLVWAFFILAAVRHGILIGSIAFGVNSGAYVSEVFRGGILSVDKGQTEAGRSLGLGYPQTMLRIILPQAIKNSLPALLNEFISLFKETSIAGMAAITDITHVGNIMRGLTFNQWPLLFLAAFYLIVVMILEFFVGIVERRLRKSDQR